MKKLIYSIRFLIVLTASLLLSTGTSHAMTLKRSGQASSWLLYEDKNSDKTHIGLRYIPELQLTQSLANERKIAAVFAVNAYSSAPTDSLDDMDTNEELKAYRAWLRVTSPQLELRAGLQKINFGPAKVLRSLKWFDHINPQDPLSLTDGVTALLARYYFLDNSNIWLWVVDGDNDKKGLELYETDDNKEEIGGRFQLALPKGEAAISYLRRYIDEADYNAQNPVACTNGAQNRYAVDLDFDLGIGAWLEASAEQLRVTGSRDEWRDMFTLGLDYTLESGIYLMYEHYLSAEGTDIDRTHETGELSTLMANYHMTFTESIKIITYYNWTNEKGSYYLDYQRLYDDWQVNVSLFKSGDTGPSPRGTGVQCMLTYNH